MRVDMSTVLRLRVPDSGCDIGRVGSKGAGSYSPFTFYLAVRTLRQLMETQRSGIGWVKYHFVLGF